MPVLWKYLLKGYFQYFLLCVSAFVAVLLVTRFQDIAHFASSGAKLKHIGLFSLYQIPYILPIAIPISSLIASMILFQKMSLSLELTALRACGIGLLPLAQPLLLAGILLSVLNLTIASEMAPITRTLAKNLSYQVASENPLLVMQKDSVLDLKTVDFNVKTLEIGKKAEEVVCIIRQTSNERLGLFTAKEISVDKDFVYGKGISVLSSVDPDIPFFDHLIIENQESMQISKPTITSYLFNTEWFAKDNLLTLKEIIKKHQQEKGNLTSKTGLEITRRVCLGFCSFTFTLMGLGFGIEISRHRKRKAILSAFFLASLILGCFVASKTVSKLPIVCLSLFVLPQIVAILASLRSLRLVSRGIE